MMRNIEGRWTRDGLLLLGILGLAFAVRVWGVGFGLPYLYHADEPVVVNHALAYGSGDLNPHFFNIPPLVSYLLFVCYGIFYAVGLGTGYFHSVRDLETLFYLDPSVFYLIARGVFGVLLGTATVGALYRLVKRFRDAEQALLAALFLAVNFLHARDSHYLYTDIPLLLVLVSGMGVFLRIPGNSAPGVQCEEGTGPEGAGVHWLSGVMIGLAAAVKYNGIFLAVPYVWICLRTVPPSKWLTAWLAAGVGSAVTFLALNPYALLDHGFFIKEILEQKASNSGGMPFFHHFRYSLTGAMGAIGLAGAVLGGVRMAFSRKPVAEAMVLFVAGYFLVLVKWGQPYDRYVLPLIPFLCIALADMVGAINRRLTPGADLGERGTKGGRLEGVRPLLFAGLIVLVAFPPLAKILMWDRLMARPDTRTLAKEWIERNIPGGSAVAIDQEFHVPRLAFTPAQLEAKKENASGIQKRRVDAYLGRTRGPFYRLGFLTAEPRASRFFFAEPGVLRDLPTLRAEGFQYVVTAVTPGTERDPFAIELKNKAVLVQAISPFRDGRVEPAFDGIILTGGPFRWKDIIARERNGYTIEIYRLR
ncbi:MAG TPA: glycosyltransferase family 87 protein [Candidatus Omnitrophota bacterium]|nr:glycosyltransferase family 87 protein [Candidatus Omnitrophota bacterium]